MLVHRSLTVVLSALGLAVLAAAAVAPPGTAAQIGQRPATAPLVDGITVTATGAARVEADTVAVRLSARSRSKTIGQALEEFRAKRTLLDKALADFADVGLTAESGGVRVGTKEADPNTVFMNDEPSDPPFEAAEIVTARFPAKGGGLDTVVALIEAAGEVGCALDDASALNPYVMIYGLGGDGAPKPPAVEFLASKDALSRARDAAMAAAFADALAQARSLAAIAGRNLRDAEAIRVETPFPDGARTSGTGPRQVTLEVRFSFE